MSYDVMTHLPAVNSIALVKPDKARMVESLLIQMARTGQLQGKVSTVCHMTAMCTHSVSHDSHVHAQCVT